MTDSPRDSRYTSHRFTEKRSVAETLLDTINETLGQTGGRPSFSKSPARRRGRLGQIAAGAGMLAGLAVLGFAFLRPAADRLPAAGDPVAFLEIARGQVELAGAGRTGASSRLLTLAGGEPVYAGTVIETAAQGRTRAGGEAGRAAIRLAGGQSMRLDGSSRVRFASSSDLVLERGAVYVDSAGGANVEVRTTLGVVRDIGTQFEVRLLDETAEPSLRVRVREGSVMLEHGGDSHHALAGEELSARGDGRVERGKASIFGPHWQWVLDTAPTPEVAGRPLADFLDWVSREGGWTVRFADAETAQIASSTMLHGDVRNLGVAEASSMVLHGSGLDYRLEDGVFVVEPRDDE